MAKLVIKKSFTLTKRGYEAFLNFVNRLKGEVAKEFEKAVKESAKQRKTLTKGVRIASSSKKVYRRK